MKQPKKRGRRSRPVPANPAAQPERELTPKEQAFVTEYLVDFNATQAAKRAGYSARAARQIGTENLAKPAIAAALSSAIAARQERTQITADRVVQRLWDIADLDLGDIFEWGPEVPGGLRLKASSEMTPGARKLLAALSVERVGGVGFGDPVEYIRAGLLDKRWALEQLALHTGAIVPKGKLEVTGKDGEKLFPGVPLAVLQQVILASEAAEKEHGHMDVGG